MKKLFSVLLALLMVFTLVGCSSSKTEETATTETAEETTTAEVKVAMITDYGDITDQSFNQTTYEACKSYAEANGLGFNYYKPTDDSDAAREASIDKAVEDGYNTIVMPGYAFAAAAVYGSETYPDVKFIALDVSQSDLDGAKAGFTSTNLYCAVYQEEIAGYMAGYAAVKMGYKKLGFLGGMAVPAVIRYGYGFVQGADAAAVELNLTDVEVNYVYGGQFYGDADITAAMDVWYGAGTEVVFACGGGIYSSACEAAAKVGAKVIGVDVDQAALLNGQYGDGICVTSAMKGLANTVNSSLDAVVNGTFDSELAGKVETLGMVSADPYSNYVGIPTTTAFNETFTEEDLAKVSADIFNGTLTVGNDTAKAAADYATVVTVNDQGSIK